MVLPTADQLDAQYPAIAPQAWAIDPDCTFLNHGSFGGCPIPVLERQQQLRDQLESNPLRFLMDTAPPLLDRSRSAMARLMQVPVDDLVFVHNATAGVNCVLRSLEFEPGDEILLFDHAYGSCANVIHHLARRRGIVPVQVNVKWPGSSPQQVLDAVAAAVTGRTKLAMLDHITSLSGLVMPMAELAEMLHQRGVDVLVDGAHGPGMIHLDVASLGVAYYVGNCHKWLCAPKAAAVLYVRPDRQQGIEPQIVSEGSRFDISGQTYGDFQQRFKWQGTGDPTAAICVADAIDFLSSLLPGGLPALMKRNHDMAVGLRRVICEAWGVPEPCPPDMIGSMAAMLIAPGYNRWDPAPKAQPQHDFVRSIRDDLNMECQCLPFGDPPRLQARLSCQAYNHGGQTLAFIDAFRDRVDPSVYEG